MTLLSVCKFAHNHNERFHFQLQWFFLENEWSYKRAKQLIFIKNQGLIFSQKSVYLPKI